MKLKTIWTVTGLIAGLYLNAQDITFGLLGGFDIADIRLAETRNTSSDSRVFHPIVSFNANGYIGFKSAGHWGLSAEPGFIQKGYQLQNEGSQLQDDARIRLSYIQLPVLIDFYLTDRLFVSAGPEFAYLVHAKLKSKNGSSGNIAGIYENNFEVSGLAGVNYRITERVDIGLRYNHGLTYTSKIEWVDLFGNPLGETKEYNQYLQLIARWRIPAEGREG